MNILDFLVHSLVKPGFKATEALSYDEVFASAQPESLYAAAQQPSPWPAIVDGEAWFHEVFAGPVF